MAQVARGGKSRGTPEESARIAGLEHEAYGLADRLPDLVLEASRVAATISHGLHGRRRTGPGDTFWQFREFHANDAAPLIDWRRSAGSDRLYVREREWEAAHTVWLWPDLSPSMDFRSFLSPVTKRDRAVVLILTAAELLVRGGERAGLLGLVPPTASRKAVGRLAAALAHNSGEPVLTASQPPKQKLSRFSGVLLVSDFLDPIATTRAHIAELAAEGVSGHLVQVLDPAEETLPYHGRTEFLGMEGDDRWLTDRAETLRPRYQARLLAHREELMRFAHGFGWSFMVHHTDRPVSEPLLTLITRLQSRGKDYRSGGGKTTEPAPKGGRS